MGLINGLTRSNGRIWREKGARIESELSIEQEYYILFIRLLRAVLIRNIASTLMNRDQSRVQGWRSLLDLLQLRCCRTRSSFDGLSSACIRIHILVAAAGRCLFSPAEAQGDKKLLSLRELAERPKADPLERRAFPTYAVFSACIVLMMGAFLLTEFTLDSVMSRILVALATINIAALALRRMNLPRLAGCIEATVLYLAISFIAATGSALIASTARPLVDEELIRWDAAIGFDWLALMDWLSNQPFVSRILEWSYDAISWEIFLLLPALFIARQESRAWTFLFAWSAALALTMVVFPFLPAVGPIVHHGLALPGIPARSGFLDVFMGVRNGTIREIGLTTVRGMVTMPSFHAASAVLIGWGFARLDYLRWPFVALNLTMVLAAIPIGGHYLVDVIAGVVVAIASIRISKLVVGLTTFSSRDASAEPKVGAAPRS